MTATDAMSSKKEENKFKSTRECRLKRDFEVANYLELWEQCPTGRVFQYRVGSGRVLEKIPGSGSGSGRVGVLKYTIGYFRVSFLLSGISGYVGNFRVFLGLPIYTRGIF